MIYRLQLIMSAITLLNNPTINDYLKQLIINQFEIKRHTHPDEVTSLYQLAYLDMSFEHSAIEHILKLYNQRIQSCMDQNISVYFKLRLVFTNQLFENLVSNYRQRLDIDKQVISFNDYVLKELNYPSVLSNDCLLIIKMDDLLNIGSDVSNYMMGYWYYQNHGRR